MIWLQLGLSSLNKDFSNLCGVFSVSAHTNADTLYVHTVEQLNQQEYEKHEWPQFKALMSNVYALAQAQILLTKKDE